MDHIILGIHGLSNKPPADQLAQGWLAAMLEGLRINTGNDLAPEDLNFGLIYWADLMYEQPDPNPELYREATPGALKTYNDNWWDGLRAWAGSAIDDVIDKWRQDYGMNELAEKLLRLKLEDLSLYYQRPAIRSALQNRLKERIHAHANRKLIIVAHSMGSIIAYDVLRQLEAEPAIAIDHFITLGSPLGLPYVKAKAIENNRQQVPQTPNSVHHWVNMADRRDPITVDTHMADDYQANPSGVRVQDDLVLNDWGAPHHKIYGYLRTPEFSNTLRDCLQ